MGNFFKNNLSKRQFYLGSQKTSFCALVKNVFFFEYLFTWIENRTLGRYNDKNLINPKWGGAVTYELFPIL